MNGQDDVDAACLPGPATAVPGMLGVPTGVFKQFSEASQAWSYTIALSPRPGLSPLLAFQRLGAANFPNTEPRQWCSLHDEDDRCPKLIIALAESSK